jgi:hypothetical protein
MFSILRRKVARRRHNRMGQLLDRYESPLFGWAASPHYLGEILSFVGSAMMSALLPIWGNALVVSAYLASRADHLPATSK